MKILNSRRMLERVELVAPREVGMKKQRLKKPRMRLAVEVERRELRKWAGSVAREWDFWKEREAAKIMPAMA
jgi:hypothetical protein